VCVCVGGGVKQIHKCNNVVLFQIKTLRCGLGQPEDTMKKNIMDETWEVKIQKQSRKQCVDMQMKRHNAHEVRDNDNEGNANKKITLEKIKLYRFFTAIKGTGQRRGGQQSVGGGGAA